MLLVLLFAILIVLLVVAFYSVRESFYQKPRPTLEQDYDRKISRDFSPLVE
jgi:hypothetical protein